MEGTSEVNRKTVQTYLRNQKGGEGTYRKKAAMLIFYKGEAAWLGKTAASSISLFQTNRENTWFPVRGKFDLLNQSNL